MGKKKYDGIFPEDIQMENKHMKTCSISLVIKKIQIKTTISHYHISTKMTKLKKKK